MSNPNKFTVDVEVKPEIITNAMVGAFEGGSNYWAREVNYISGPKKTGHVFYGEDEYWADPDFKFEIIYDDPNLDEGNGKGKKIIGPEDIRKGIKAMYEAKDIPEGNFHFHDLLSNGRDDASTHDVFLQYVVLGEVIYG